MQDAPAASTAYVGLRDVGVEGGGRTWKLRELVGPGAADEFQLIKCEAGYVLTFLFFIHSLILFTEPPYPLLMLRVVFTGWWYTPTTLE